MEVGMLYSLSGSRSSEVIRVYLVYGNGNQINPLIYDILSMFKEDIFLKKKGCVNFCFCHKLYKKMKIQIGGV